MKITVHELREGILELYKMLFNNHNKSLVFSVTDETLDIKITDITGKKIYTGICTSRAKQAYDFLDRKLKYISEK